MTDKILLNICMPFYNSSQYLKEAINSIVKQTYKDWKLWIYNDGSSVKESKSLKTIINEFDMDYEIVGDKKLGVFGARICLLKAIKEGYVLFMDADDFYTNKNVFKLLVETIKKNDADMVFFNYTNNLKTQKKFCSFDDFKCDKEYVMELTLNSNRYNSLCTKIFNIKKFNGLKFDLEDNIPISEDRLLSVAIMNMCKNFNFVDEIIYYYRDNEESATNINVGLDKIECQIRVENKISKIINNGYSYNKENYFSEHIIYPHLWFIYKNVKENKKRLKLYNQTYHYVLQGSNLEVSNKCEFHRKITLILFRKKQFKQMDLWLSIIKKIKK